MIHLQLTDDQAVVLRQVLSSTVSDLGMEIADTDSYDFRQRLKRDKSLAMEILGQLERGES